jgi:hypothetical protein
MSDCRGELGTQVECWFLGVKLIHRFENPLLRSLIEVNVLYPKVEQEGVGVGSFLPNNKFNPHGYKLSPM